LRPLVVPEPLSPFDLNDVAAREMLAAIPAVAGTVAIAGVGKLGQAVAGRLAAEPVTKIVAWDRRAENKAEEVLRRRDCRVTDLLVGVDAELDFHDLRTKTGGTSVGAVFVCINDDAISGALAYEIERNFPEAVVCARVSTTHQGIGKLLTAATAARPDNRVHFVGFHDAAKDLGSLRSQAERMSSA